MTDEREDPRFLGLKRSLGVLLLVTLGVSSSLFGVTVVKGGSMRPALHPGDIVVYRRGDVGLGPGRIVLFEKAGWRSGVLHRVIGTGDESIETKGDANAESDMDPVPTGDVRGVVIGVLPLGKLAESASGYSR